MLEVSPPQAATSTGHGAHVSGAERTGTVVAYGDHPDQVADLTVPAGPPPQSGWPTVVLVHGGFWRERYRRELMTPLADDLAARGFAAWNVEYRRVGGAGGWPWTLTDVAVAVDHLAVVAPESELDLDRVVVVGHSAGGHLALWLAGRSLLPADAPGAGPVVHARAVVGQAPVADLTAGVDLGDGAPRELLGGGPAEVAARYAVADPARLVGHGVPVLLVHGEGDDTVPVDQSRRYRDAAAVAGDETALVALPGGHMDCIDPGGPLWEAVVAFVEQRC
jgi:acetyl esterase/lipase